MRFSNLFVAISLREQAVGAAHRAVRPCRFRVRVEHTIARFKSFRMFAERYRYPRSAYAAKFAIIANILNLAAGF